MAEWIKRHEELVKKQGTERAVVLIDAASKELLKDLGISFNEIKLS